MLMRLFAGRAVSMSSRSLTTSSVRSVPAFSSSFVPSSSSSSSSLWKSTSSEALASVARPVLLNPWMIDLTPLEKCDPAVTARPEAEELEQDREGLRCDNLIRKRRRKMNKHKHSKMLKKQRFLRRKLGK
jgi:hypothetical protein